MADSPDAMSEHGIELELFCAFCGKELGPEYVTNVCDARECQLDAEIAWAEMERAEAKLPEDHPAGCFFGSFAGAYSDRWHIPAGVDCPLDHGTDPIRLEGKS